MAAPAEGKGAAPKAVVLAFEGPNGAYARNLVVREVSDRLDLVPRRQVEAAARKHDADLTARLGMAEVAHVTKVQVFVRGRVVGKGGAARVRLFAYDADGTEIAAAVVKVPPTAEGRRALARAAGKVADEAIQAIAPRPRAPAAASTEAAVEDASGADDGDDGDDTDRTAPSHAPLMTILAGAGGRTRRADIELTTGDRRRYESGIFLEIPVHLDIRPLANKGGRAAAGFTLQGDFAMAVALASVDQATGNQVDTSAYRFAVHTGYVHPFDRGAFGVLAGYHHEAFRLGDNPVLPSSVYPTVRAALTGRYDLLGPLLYTRLDAGFRYLLGLGELADAFGADADGLGFDVQATLGGAHASGFTYALRLTVEHAILRLDGEAADAPAEGGTELGFALGAYVGWGL